MMNSSLKKEVRRILYLRVPKDISYKQLADFSGIEHIRVNCHNRKVGKANKCELNEFLYKIEMVCEATKDAETNEDNKEIMEIIDYEPTDTELAEYVGVTQQAISDAKNQAKKKASAYAYAHHRAHMKIKKFAELTGA